MLSKKDWTTLGSMMMLQTVKESGGKLKAAKNWNISIDTLNKYLDGLEKDLGLKLLSITDRKCSLTFHGDKIVDIVDQVKSLLEKTKELSEVNKSAKGEVKVVYGRNVRTNVYTKGVDKFFAKYKDIALKVDVFDEIPDMNLMAYDICLCYDQLPKGDDLVVLMQKDVPCGYFASSEYLKHNPYPQSLKDLFENHRLVLRRNDRYQTRIESALKHVSREPFVSNSSFVVNDVIIGGGGVGVMPMTFAKDNLGLVCLDNIKTDMKMTLYLLAHRSVKDIPRVRVVIDYYKSLIDRL